jgi:hypothetical protein
VLTYVAVYTIMAAAVAWTIFGERRRAHREDQGAREHRDDPPRTAAWPPQPPPGLHIPAGRYPCGCVLATTPDGVHLITCPAHDPQFVSEWEQKL